MLYFSAFLFSFLFSLFFTLKARDWALKLKIIDQPNAQRKIHQSPTPLMGGLAIFLAFFLALFIFRKNLIIGDLNYGHWLSFFGGACFLLLGGLLDEKYNLKPIWQIIWPILASITIILGGVSIEKVSGFQGAFFYLPFYLSSLFIFFWILGMTYTTKLLDGLDGLASGVSAIGALIIFLFTTTTKYYQPDIALASLIFFAVLLGFLIFNFNPAKIFLGESGSLLLGYILGVLAIISGGKIAIALLVMGLPILDVLWTIIRRWSKGKNPFRAADRQHLHHRLLDLGFSQKKVALFFYCFSIFFGLSALFLQSRGKFWALIILVLIMLTLIIFFSFLDKKNKKQERRKKLLLHICCAPCGAYLISEKLLSQYEPILYFYNSNIDSYQEYRRRLFYVKKLARLYKLKLKIEPYRHNQWLKLVKGREGDLEGGERCFLCYQDRLEKTAQLAQKLKIDNFYTTLVSSPYKKLSKIQEIGLKLGKKYQINFLNLDFDQSDLYQKLKQKARDLGFYQQKYCACEFTKNPNLID